MQKNNGCASQYLSCVRRGQGQWRDLWVYVKGEAVGYCGLLLPPATREGANPQRSQME